MSGQAWPLSSPVFLLATHCLIAMIAYAVARIMHGRGAEVKQAQEISSYELLEPIGEGGMGQVWRARHRLLARPAAIKLISPALLAKHQEARCDTLRRFEREARHTARLGSSHTIDVYDFGVSEDGNFYYVMELLDGLSLERFVKDHGPMRPERVVYLLQQVCHSLGEAHKAGLIHRDIKPANIFMCRLGPDVDFVKVLDFGLVRHFGSGPSDTMPTVEDVVAGTPAYMPPEIARGDTRIDGRADLYSLGCVAYFLLTGHPVFVRDTPLATVLAHATDPPVPPSKTAKAVLPPALDALILECLAKDQADRPATAEVLAERLAATVPAAAWSPTYAHRWWDVHREPMPSSTANAHDSATDILAPRCRPVLARRPLATRPVEN
jgi:serine/threonine protein kinase